MNNKQFLQRVIELYHKARKPLFTNAKIRRGRSHSIASAVEDLFADYLIKKIKADYILIDQPITVPGFKAQIYPDILIIRKGKIVAFCDVKMDLGWKRKELYNYCKRHAALLKKIKGKTCKIKDGQTKEVKFFAIDKKASLNVVVISDQNINPKILAAHISKAKSLSHSVEIFVLTKGEHPNTYGYSVAELMSKIKVNDQDFSKIVKKLN